jgi:hypothetical protein
MLEKAAGKGVKNERGKEYHKQINDQPLKVGTDLRQAAGQ